jgi:hypothetical protein
MLLPLARLSLAPEPLSPITCLHNRICRLYLKTVLAQGVTMSSFAPSMMLQFAGLGAGPKGAPPAIPPIIINPVVDSGIPPYGRRSPHPAIDPYVAPAKPPVTPPPAPSISTQGARLNRVSHRANRSRAWPD